MVIQGSSALDLASFFYIGIQLSKLAVAFWLKYHPNNVKPNSNQTFVWTDHQYLELRIKHESNLERYYTTTRVYL